jgi:capsular exopolysaccharide synthesis family protein
MREMAKNSKNNTSEPMTTDMIMRERRSMFGPGMNFAAAEAYKLLRTNITFSFSGNEECRIIGMTSSFRGEGKSLTSMNLAYTIAEADKRVLLIEGDMRLPTVSKRMGLRAKPGLSNLLVGLESISSAIQEYRVDLGDKILSLDVMVSGDIPPNPSELLGSERMKSLLKKLRERYDYVILDLPPVNAVTDALIASRVVDGIIVVVRNGHAVRGALAETMRQLRLAEAHVLGFVFNDAGGTNSKYYSKKGYYSSNYYHK